LKHPNRNQDILTAGTDCIYFRNLVLAIYSYLLKWKGIFFCIFFCFIFIIQQLKFFDDFPDNIPSIAEAEFSLSKPSKNLSLFLKDNYSYENTL
jgi:hypothetical protein